MKLPISVLVVIHTPALEVLLLERAQRPGFWQSVTGSLDRLDELPAQAALGASGHIATLNGHAGCASNAEVMPVQLRLDWALAADESVPDVRFFCIRQSAFLRGSLSYVTETCIELAAAGVLGSVARFKDQDGMFWWAR